MGAGKTIVGRELATLLNWSFFDLDHEIEVREELPVREFFQRYGEARFREVETEGLTAVLRAASAPTVIALGGGTFIQPANVEMLRRRGAQVVFLETPIEELIERCCLADSPENPRPLAATPEAFLALYQQRLPYYRKADFTVNAAGQSVEQIVQKIVAGLRLRQP